MRRFILVVGLSLVVAGAVLWWVKFDRQPPEAVFQDSNDVVGREATWDVVVRTGSRSGLRRIDVRLLAGGKIYQLFEDQIPETGWLGSGVEERPLRVVADLRAAGVPEGPARLEVLADTYAWHLIPPRPAPAASREIVVDTSPPRVVLLSAQHNIRLGGSSVVLFRVSPDTEVAGVAMGEYFFPAVRGYYADPEVALSIFAVPESLSPEAQPKVRAVDAVGNALEVPFPVRVRARSFPERPLNIDDAFLQRKIPEIYAAIGESPPDDLVKGYLYLNGELRKRSEEKIRKLTAKSAPEPLWDGAFRRQTNSAPMSAFADRRIYLHDGEEIDRRTHLGFDLASLRLAPVEAAQNGIVVLADYLGIYGSTVILDHGLGVFTLYGHMSTLAVQPGQRVAVGETLGQSGETGLAGGDHIHFSTMLWGVHVDPIEWWDGKWIRDHVTAKLSMFERPAGPEDEKEAEAPAADGTPDPVADGTPSPVTDGTGEPG